MSDIHFEPNSKEESLAQELAEVLKDPDGLPLYLTVARRYSESHIRSILSRVMEMPADRIRTSRGALFTWLIKHHGERRRKPQPPSDTRD